MTRLIKTAATAFFIGAAALQPAVARFDDAVTASANVESALFYTSRQASAFYTLDHNAYRATVMVVPGPQGQGREMQFANTLGEGETAEYFVAGDGVEAPGVILRLRRSGERMFAEVLSEPSNEG